MENEKTKEEMIHEVEEVEEESLKFDKQKVKKIVKRILIGSGLLAIVGGAVAAYKSHSNEIDYTNFNSEDNNPVEIPETTVSEETSNSEN